MIEDLQESIRRYHTEAPHRFEIANAPFVIGEFGCATGATSVLPLSTIIKEVRNINPDLEILIMLNDLPENHHT